MTLNKSISTALSTLANDTVSDVEFASAAQALTTVIGGLKSFAAFCRHAAESESRVTVLCEVIASAGDSEQRVNLYRQARTATQDANKGWTVRQYRDENNNPAWKPVAYDAKSAAEKANARDEKKAETKRLADEMAEKTAKQNADNARCAEQWRAICAHFNLADTVEAKAILEILDGMIETVAVDAASDSAELAKVA